MKIVLIEDNPGDARLVREILKDAQDHFAVRVAERLAEGVELLGAQAPDVVLLDLNLPDSHGLATLTELQKQFPRLPVVIMTSIDDAALGEEAVRLGAQDYLVKGHADGQVLSRALAYAVERKRAEQAQRRQRDKLRDSRRAALSLMEDALAAKQQAEQANAELQQEIAERRRVEAALRESEEELRLAQAAGGVGTFDWDLAGQAARCSDEYFHVMDRPRPTDGMVSFDEWQSWLHPDDRDAILAALQAALDGTGEARGEYRMTGRDGQVRWILYQGQIYREADGRPLRMIGTAQDITERKQVEQALRDGEQRLARAQEIAHLGSWELDLVKDELTWSDEVYRIFGLEPQEFGATYEAFLQHVHPDDREAVNEAYSSSVRDGKDSYEIEHRVVRRRTGEIRWVHEKCEHVRDGSGQIVRSVGMVLDITERKQAEEALRQSEARLALAASGTRIGMYDRNVATGEALWTEQVARLLGLRTTTTTTTTTISQVYHYHDWTERVHPEDLTRVEAELHRCMTEQAPFETEYRVVWPDGTVHWLADRGVFQCESERCTRMLGIVIDVTERKRAEAEIRRNELRLESLLRIAQSSAGSIAELLDLALDEALSLTGSKIGYIYDYDEATEELTLNTWSRGVMEQCRIPQAATAHRLDTTGLWGEAVRQARPIIVNDFQAAHPLKRGYPEGHARILKYLTLPVFSDGHIVGVIGVANKETDYDDSDVRQLTLLMDSAWKIAEREKARRALQASEERYRSLFNGMTEGFALHELVCDGRGRPRDYRFLDLNPAFERLTGLARERVAGELVSRVLPDEAAKWVKRYAPVVQKGEPIHFEDYSPGLGKHFEVFAYRPAAGQFAVLFLDVSERVTAQRALQEAHEELQEQAEELAAVNEELQTQTEELATTNEELRLSEQALLARSQEVEAAYAEVENERLRLEAVMEALPVGVALTDTKGETLRANAAFEQVWGGPRPPVRSARDYAAYKAWWADTGKAVTPRQWASLQAVREGEPVVGQVLEIERFDGARAFVINSASPVRDTRGKIVGAAVAIQDITDLRRAQEELRNNEQRLRLALEGGRMGCWEQDFEDQTSIWSDSMYEMLGLDPARTVASSRTLYDHVHPDDRAALERVTGEAVERETEFQAEFRVVRPDRQTAWLASRGRVIRDAAGKATRMMGVIYDVSARKEMEAELRRLNVSLEEEVAARTKELAETVDTLRDEVTQRRRAEEALRERSRILEGFFRHSITPLAFMDAQFNFIRVNEAYAQADEKSPEDYVGKNHFEMFPNEENQAIFEQVVRTKEPYHAYAKPFVYPYAPERGTSYWTWLLTPLLDEAGEVEYLVLNLEDVTERQRAFEELERRATQLQRLTLELSQTEDRERQRLAEVLHDDLQQLLVGAKLHLNILAGRAAKDGEIGEVVAQVRNLITESINKSRGLSHELSPPLLQQNALSDALTWLGERMLTTCGLAVDVDARPDADVGNEALRTFVYKAAQEMLFNVVKHARTKEATLQLRRVGGFVRVIVSDKGQGFDERTLTARSGAGLGLFSIQERVQLLGGWMKFKSTPGKGSVFVLAIPDRGEPATGPGAVDAVAAAGAQAMLPVARHRLDSGCIRVLLVDDHHVMRQGVAALLEEERDIEVVGQASNGREAVTMAAALQPDVIVMDMAMPVLNGDEAARQIKVQLPSVRIIGLSLAQHGTAAEKMLKAGAEVFLSKTDPSDKLLAAIRGTKRKR